MSYIVKQENFVLVETVNMVAIGGRPISIQIAPDMKVTFIFEGEEDKDQDIKFEIEGNNLKIRLKNFNNSLGTSTIEPIKIGDVNGKGLFVHFYVITIGSKVKTRTFTCSFFLEETNGTN